jgi:hypothetical protein
VRVHGGRHQDELQVAALCANIAQDNLQKLSKPNKYDKETQQVTNKFEHTNFECSW